ncbi:hypothetical protein Tco_1505206 [Tanacetum coccineum]
MNPDAAQQVALDNALVSLEKRLKIEKCNARIDFSKLQREATYQVTLDALKLSPCYPAFLITAKICLILPNQDFVEPPSKDEMVPFIQELGYSRKCISGKTTGLDRLKESRAQILWGMYNEKNVDFVALRWEDFMFQADNREISSARKKNMPYPRFTKVIISHFISKDKTISMRNRINLHTVRDDTLLDIKDSKAYKTYLDFATGKSTPKKARKFKKVASPSKKLSPILEEEPAEKPKRAKKSTKKSTIVPIIGVVIRDTPSVFVSKKKALTKADRGKGMNLLSEATLLEVAQLKKTLKKSKLETHKLHASGSGDEVSSQPKVLDESEDKKTSTDEGTGTKPFSMYPNINLRVKMNLGETVMMIAMMMTVMMEVIMMMMMLTVMLNDDEEEEYKEEHIRTPDNFEFTDDDEEYEELYKDVNVKLKAIEHEEEGKGDAEMTDAGHDDGT